uniref:uncharacterized protein LOC120833746 n=1 Tax=Gasterosteus aculeatus aculeatus TaxID=481459 RepID=UPI001A996700|nr:uncharacterized protein LOC120833746 [Gasterosteus aculeatus aculeatus]
MSQSSSYRRDTASASPESLKEGDFLPRHLYDNPKSLEEKETCDDQKDPLVNITTDDYAGSPFNIQVSAPPAANDLGKLCAAVLPQERLRKKSDWREARCFSTSLTEKGPPVSPEPGGGFITLVGAQSQTDWKWVEQRISLGCQAERGDPELLQAEGMDIIAHLSEEPCDETMAKAEYDIPGVGPPRLIAHEPEPKRALHVAKVPEVESKQGLLLAHLFFCQQLCQPFVQSQPLENETNLQWVFWSEQAKQIRELIQGEKEKLEQKESDRKIDVNPHASVMSDEEREAAKALAIESLRDSQLQRILTIDDSNSSSKYATSQFSTN